MTLNIRLCTENDVETVVAFSIAAWEPVFMSFAKIMGPAIFALQYPDWRKEQGELVEKTCRNTDKLPTYVAEVDGKAVGFITIELNQETKFGEVYMLAVDPAYQNRGIGAGLNAFALQYMRDAGMKLAVVGTGGEEGHAPARASYEKAGYTGLPLMRYYQAL